jgi:hypothetical protein
MAKQVPGFPQDTVRDETSAEKMAREEQDIDRFHLHGAEAPPILGESPTAVVHEYGGPVDSDGEKRPHVYKERGETAIGPGNNLKER